MKITKVGFGLILCLSLFAALTLTALAQEQSAENGNAAKVYLPLIVTGGTVDNAQGATALTILDPNHVISAEELQANAEEDRKVAQAIQEMSDVVRAAGSNRGIVTLNVGSDGQFREPNLPAYYNHCGPSASQVALKVNMLSVLDLDRLAANEKTNVGKTGTYMEDICPALNTQLTIARVSKSYVVNYHDNGSPRPQDQFANNIMIDTNQAKPVVTGIDTQGIDGWRKRAPHIVTVRGYENWNSSTQGALPPDIVYYVDTASQGAGYGGSYFVKTDMGTFWKWIHGGLNVKAYCR